MASMAKRGPNGVSSVQAPFARGPNRPEVISLALSVTSNTTRMRSGASQNHPLRLFSPEARTRARIVSSTSRSWRVRRVMIPQEPAFLDVAEFPERIEEGSVRELESRFGVRSPDHAENRGWRLFLLARCLPERRKLHKRSKLGNSANRTVPDPN